MDVTSEYDLDENDSGFKILLIVLKDVIFWNCI